MTLPSSITVQVEGDLAENKKKDELQGKLQSRLVGLYVNFRDFR